MLDKNKEKHLNELVGQMLGQAQGHRVCKADTGFTPGENIAQIVVSEFEHKLLLLNLAEELGNVSQACRLLGLSRNTFYRYKAAFARDGVEALLEKSQKQQNLNYVVEVGAGWPGLGCAIDNPAHSRIKADKGFSGTGTLEAASTVRNIWLRDGLAAGENHLGVETKGARHAPNLTLPRVVAILENTYPDNGIVGRADSPHPGYLGEQDTIYVGAFKGIGLVYQQVFVDTYSEVAFAKLYTAKTAVTAVDLLSGKVLPFFARQKLPLLNILTGRGSQYCGSAGNHDYRGYLAINAIGHKKAKVKSTQANHLCGHFYQAFLTECKAASLSKNVYKNLVALQRELDGWLSYYNNDRPNFSRICSGRTPIATLRDGKKKS